MDKQIKKIDILQELLERNLLGRNTSLSVCAEAALTWTKRQLQRQEVTLTSETALRRCLRIFCTAARARWKSAHRTKNRLFSKYGYLYEGSLTVSAREKRSGNPSTNDVNNDRSSSRRGRHRMPFTAFR